jgi:hypothetical protein
MDWVWFGFRHWLDFHRPQPQLLNPTPPRHKRTWNGGLMVVKSVKFRVINDTPVRRPRDRIMFYMGNKMLFFRATQGIRIRTTLEDFEL